MNFHVNHCRRILSSHLKCNFPSIEDDYPSKQHSDLLACGEKDNSWNLVMIQKHGAPFPYSWSVWELVTATFLLMSWFSKQKFSDKISLEGLMKTRYVIPSQFLNCISTINQAFYTRKQVSPIWFNFIIEKMYKDQERDNYHRSIKQFVHKCHGSWC